MQSPQQYLNDVIAAGHAVDLQCIQKAVDLLAHAYRQNRTVFVIGNGGSAANASHFAQDLSKGAIPSLDGKRFRVLSLTDNMPFITAVANDLGYDRVFEFQLRQFAHPGDVLIAISGSGNSPNVLKAASWARKARVKVVGVTGFDGGRLIRMSDHKIHVPCGNMCKVEAVHGILFHMIADLLKERLCE